MITVNGVGEMIMEIVVNELCNLSNLKSQRHKGKINEHSI